ncbi:hypothetical protein PHMEG_0001534 [Phytophthora megakarya]|uniref:Uncharacterized protein n=1 Tax=Phytophthora megakarya TaxID=4795 RepID=A0A225X0A4_9STRA|nr:hypothetical protein PHMEG_0001534 [Phytophthora megakarya]
MAETIARGINDMVVRLIQSNPGDKWIGGANPKYYVMAHYSHDKYPNFVAAYDKLTQVLVIVALNLGEAQTITFDLSELAYVEGPINTWTTEPNKTEGTVRIQHLQPRHSLWSKCQIYSRPPRTSDHDA